MAKMKKNWSYQQHDASQKHTNWKKPNIKDATLRFHVSEILEKTKLQWEKADQWLPVSWAVKS